MCRRKTLDGSYFEGLDSAFAGAKLPLLPGRTWLAPAQLQRSPAPAQKPLNSNIA